MKMARFLRRRGRDYLASWLPVLMMMGMTLASWWLVRSAPRFPDLVEAPAPTHEPDYHMQDFTVRNFNASGVLTSQLTGVDATHFPDTDALEVTLPRIRASDKGGQPLFARAERGISNHDGSEVQLRGDARLVREATQRPDGTAQPRLEFRSEAMDALTDREYVSSDEPVELLRGVDRFTGDAFDYDNRSGIANLRGNVRALIQPARESVGGSRSG